MGTFSLTDDLVRQTPDGKTLTFSSFTDTDGVLKTPGSGMWLGVNDEKGNDWGVFVPREHWSPKWELDWFDAFCHHPEWRTRFVESANAVWGDSEKLPALPVVIAERRRNEQVKKLLGLGPRARFKDFADLKSGNDSFSKLKGEALFGQLGDAERSGVFASELDDEHKAKAARWVLRGLPLDWAVRKVKTDMEISANAEARRASWPKMGR